MTEIPRTREEFDFDEAVHRAFHRRVGETARVIFSRVLPEGIPEPYMAPGIHRDDLMPAVLRLLNQQGAERIILNPELQKTLKDMEEQEDIRIAETL